MSATEPERAPWIGRLPGVDDMTAPHGTLRLIPSTFKAYAEPGSDTDLGTFDSDDMWAFPPFAWRLPAAALAVGVAAGWLLRGAR